MCKKLCFIFSLLFLSLGLQAEYVLSDSSFLRLRVLIVNLQTKSDKQDQLLQISDSQLKVSRALTQKEAQTIVNSQIQISNLSNLLNQAEATNKKQSELLTQQFIGEIVKDIAIGAGAFGLGYLAGKLF